MADNQLSRIWCHADTSLPQMITYSLATYDSLNIRAHPREKTSMYSRDLQIYDRPQLWLYSPKLLFKFPKRPWRAQDKALRNKMTKADISRGSIILLKEKIAGFHLFSWINVQGIYIKRVIKISIMFRGEITFITNCSLREQNFESHMSFSKKPFLWYELEVQTCNTYRKFMLTL